eukprot:CAMPEP_0181180078 /NCGR_PEP_ID=MMETSP1096-20121128/6604_1 /TAXON_ID=156174 ORGANISM="Chrysochromulina ericina, Strain CCMP281" /NCGR_SAMPLE_ID=MMETSP1096 /ASSEMBLY_ACC=CAM_ASM_000453 /LENGTH=266 /DNA_ID=CAMNT_0023268475 /DNA_START=525 /DNA_END=1326 /DNA_ORIENTATION=-
MVVTRMEEATVAWSVKRLALRQNRKIRELEAIHPVLLMSRACSQRLGCANGLSPRDATTPAGATRATTFENRRCRCRKNATGLPQIEDGLHKEDRDVEGINSTGSIPQLHLHDSAGGMRERQSAMEVVAKSPICMSLASAIVRMCSANGERTRSSVRKVWLSPSSLLPKLPWARRLAKGPNTVCGKKMLAMPMTLNRVKVTPRDSIMRRIAGAYSNAARPPAEHPEISILTGFFARPYDATSASMVAFTIAWPADMVVAGAFWAVT